MAHALRCARALLPWLVLVGIVLCARLHMRCTCHSDAIVVLLRHVSSLATGGCEPLALVPMIQLVLCTLRDVPVVYVVASGEPLP